MSARHGESPAVGQVSIRDYSCKTSRVSSIRIFILGSLAERGPMHGHQMRLQAEQDHTHMWTDFTVGSIYGAMKRLATEGEIQEMRTERAGHRPERQIYEITESGRAALHEMSLVTLRNFTLRPDPFDLALSRMDPASLPQLTVTLHARRAAIEAAMSTHQANVDRVASLLSVAETHTMTHQRFRLQAELDSLDAVIADLPAILTDEQSRKAP